jgi:hypothetical protein
MPTTVVAQQTDTSAKMTEVDLQSYGAYGRTYEELINDVIHAGGDYKTIHSKLTHIFDGDGGECSVGRKVQELKLKVWKVSKGVAGVEVNVNGTMMDWTEFVKFAFDITPRRLNQLLDIEDAAPQTKPKPKEKESWAKRMTKDELEKLKQQKFEEGIEAASATPEEVKAKLRGAEDEYQADIEAAWSEAYEQGVRDAQVMESENKPPVVENNMEPEPASDTSKAKRWFKVGADSRTLGIGTKNDLRAQGKQQHDEPPPSDEIGESAEQGTEQRKAQPTIKLDSKDPYAYFEQFKDEPQTMASELAAMLLEFRLDEQQTTTVLDLLKKQLKAQRKALAA